MPALLVEQQRPDDAARALLHHPLDLGRLPRLAEALQGLFAALAAEGLDPARLCGVPTAERLLAARPTVAALFAHSLFGTGLPLLGAWPHEREVLARDLLSQTPEAVIDLRLSGNLVHELCHGPAEGAVVPWILAEAAALHLGAAAREAHIFPEEEGEAVPGVSLFACLADGLVRRFGRRALWGLVTGVPLAEAFGERAALVLEAAAWQEWRARPEAPFARDALAAMAWIKLAEWLPDHRGERLLARAAEVPWSALPAWQREPDASDATAAARAVQALFQINRVGPIFQTVPAEVPGARLWLDVAGCTLQAVRRRAGVFAEPAFWIFPPPLCRRLFERGARRLRIEGATRALCAEVARGLVDLALAEGPLEEEVAWTSSP